MSSPGAAWGFGFRGIHGRITFVACTLAYILLLQWAYVGVVAPLWGYAGYTFDAPPIAYWIAFSCAALLPALWVPLALARPSQWLYLYLYVAMYIPTCIVPLFQAGEHRQSAGELVPLVVTLLICMAGLGAIYRIPLFRIAHLRVSRLAYWSALVGATLAAYVLVYATFGASLRLAPQSDVIAQRLLGRETAVAAGAQVLVGYALNWPAYVIHPLLMALGLRWRKPLLVVWGVAGQLFAYSVNAVRGPLATIPLVFLLWYFARKRRVPFATLWVAFFALLVLVVVVICAVVSDHWTKVLVSWVLLRAFLGLGYITGTYFTFFANNPLTYFSQVRGLGWLGPNPYGTTSLGLVIGDFLGQPNNNANANMWADGFASYGLIGMLLVTAVAALAFYLADSCLREVDTRLATVVLGAQALNLADVPIFTSLLGGGLALVVVLVYLLPLRDELREPSRSQMIGPPLMGPAP